MFIFLLTFSKIFRNVISLSVHWKTGWAKQESSQIKTTAGHFHRNWDILQRGMRNVSSHFFKHREGTQSTKFGGANNCNISFPRKILRWTFFFWQTRSHIKWADGKYPRTFKRFYPATLFIIQDASNPGGHCTLYTTLKDGPCLSVQSRHLI